ncbi:hypothetical protein GWK47_017184 [Chionoecetes opilio]|uniref:Uncharacterized protein n=1 Tax=Chionoecetes opilio TaxID=41210 RepID=A0A8J4Y0F6_CHIOP|nr:hypothetical protein GWK47_017184 [Chionoecetes opilio]
MLHFNLSRCRIKRMACHVSGSILAEIGGALNGTNLFLAVTSDEAAQELMFNLSNMNLKPFALSLHLTKDVSPKALRTIEGISLLDLYVSEVQDSDLDRVLEMAKAILPQNKGLYELRFPRSPLTSAGCKSLLEKMKKAGVSARLLYIHEEVVLQQDEQEWLEDFARKELGCRFLSVILKGRRPPPSMEGVRWEAAGEADGQKQQQQQPVLSSVCPLLAVEGTAVVWPLCCTAARGWSRTRGHTVPQPTG